MAKTECKRCGKLFEQPDWKAALPRYRKKTCGGHLCHYQRKGTPEERFLAKVKKLDTGCWQWTGSLNARGYAEFWGGKKNFRAHRWAYTHFVGPFPKGKEVVRHKCDNSWCVNPEHLEAGTLSDNSRDMLRRGRAAKWKLKPEQVRAIAERVKGQPVKQSLYRQLEKEFGVGEQAIYLIHTGRTWSYITGFPRMKLSGKNDFSSQPDPQKTK